MNIAIMQPYLFPYIGYWQLVNAVDTFVIYDDVNYIKQGFINRNSILINGEKQRLTLNVTGASSNRKINEICIGDNSENILKTISQNYNKAPQFENVYPLLTKLLLNKDTNLARFIGFTITEISSYLGISTDLIYSSDIKKRKTLTAQDRLIEMCHQIGADTYFNMIGGSHLYSKSYFELNGLKLKFMKPLPVNYNQFGNDHIPNLSIIDVMMFNDRENTRAFLDQYKLL